MGDFSAFPDADLCPAAREVAVSLTKPFWGLLNCHVLLDPSSLCLHVEYFYLLSTSRAADPKKQQHNSLAWAGATAQELFLCGTETPNSSTTQTIRRNLRSCWFDFQSRLCTPAAQSLLPGGKGSAAWEVNKHDRGWLSELQFSSHFQGHLKNGAQWHFLALSISSVCAFQNRNGCWELWGVAFVLPEVWAAEAEPLPCAGHRTAPGSCLDSLVMLCHCHSSCPHHPDLLSRFYLLRDPESGLNITPAVSCPAPKGNWVMTFWGAAGDCRDHHSSGFSELRALATAREPTGGIGAPLWWLWWMLFV